LLEGLRACGAAAALELAEDVISLFGAAGPSRSMDERGKQLDKLAPKLVVRLSDEFLALRDDTRERLREYGARNRSAFGVR